MQLLRWNNSRPQGPQGKSAEPSASYRGQGLEVRKHFSLPVEGEIFFLTFPFIDQAITVRREKALVHSGRKDPPGPGCVQQLQMALHASLVKRASFPRAGCGNSACPVR